MRYKIMVWALAFFVSLACASASLTDMIMSYHTFDNSNTSGITSYDLTGRWNGTLKNGLNGTTGETGILGECYSYDHTNDFINLSNAMDGTTWIADNWSISLWFKMDDWGGNRNPFGMHVTGQNDDYVQVYFKDSDNKMWIETRRTNTNDVGSSGGYDTNTSWHHLVVVVDTVGKVRGLYIDNVSQGTDATNSLDLTGMDRMYIGQIPYTSENVGPWGGLLDEFAIFNATINASVVSTLYNGGSGYNPFTPTATPTPIDLFNIEPSSNQYFDTGSITFNVTVNSSLVFNISLYLNSTENETYTNKAAANNSIFNYSRTLSEGNWSYYFYGVNNDTSTTSSTYYLVVDTTSPVITSSFNNSNWTNNMTVSFSVSDSYLANVSWNDSCGNGYANTSLTGLSYTESFNVTSCSLGAKTLNITACDEAGNCDTQYYNFNNMARLNISAVNFLDKSTVTNFSVYIGGVLQGSTTTGSYNLDNLTEGSHTIMVNATNLTSDTQTVSITTAFSNQTFYLYELDSFQFTIKDEKTLAIIDSENITIEFISDEYSANFSTENGTFIASLFTPDFYTIRYRSDSYYENFYYYTLVSDSYNNLTLYMSNRSINKNITAVVYDQTNQLVEDVYLYIYRYDVYNNTYNLVGMSETNFEGETIIHLEKNTEYYKFMLYYPWGTLNKETTPTYIFDNTINFQILTGTPVGTNFFRTMDVDYNLTFNDATNNFRFTYNDPYARVSQGCLEVYELGVITTTLLNRTCLSSTGGTILINVNTINGTTYLAKALVSFSPDDYYLASLEKTYFADTGIGLMGVLVTLMMTVIFAFVGVFSVPIAAIITPLPILFSSIAGVINLPIPVAIGIFLGGITLAVMLYRSG